MSTLQGEVLLGRSRSAEYGRVRIRTMELDRPSPGSISNEALTLWLLSDVALIDSQGRMSIEPNGDTLGIPDAAVAWDKTFVRTRRYSPWNAARHGFDRERQVLTAGSVIHLNLKTALSVEMISRLHQGLGLYREAGLGRVWVNPPMLADEHPSFKSTNRPDTAVSPGKPDDPLIAWLQSRRTDWKEQAEEEARRLAESIAAAIKRARHFAGVAPALPYGPSKSQWGTVMHAAKNAHSSQALQQKLFEGDAAVIKPKGEGWLIEIPPEDGREEWKNLASFLREQLKPKDEADRIYIHKIRVLSRHLQDDIEKRRV
ncbi:MAG: hypothetical protein KZQ58_08970 [gamma proteobacterium symbiont of Bathyaustriella thionipta]|nr:hypothetical protein [gamma proteobacterium symbiont of Bathyaustriella thionipta]